MLISVLNIKVTCEWHKAIKLNYKNTRTTVVFVLGFPSTLHRAQLIRYLVTHSPRSLRYDIWCMCDRASYTGCPRRNVPDFGRVFLMLNYTDITQNTYIQSWTVTEIMAREKCGLLGGPRSVRRPWRHTRTLRIPGNETLLANIVIQWPWRVRY